MEDQIGVFVYEYSILIGCRIEYHLAAQSRRSQKAASERKCELGVARGW